MSSDASLFVRMIWFTPAFQGTLGCAFSKKVTRLFRLTMLTRDWSCTMFVFGALKLALGPLGPRTGLSRDFEFDAERLLLLDALLGSAPYC